jgi:NAD(P)-dependent dehydrogenase (short-subunit alcohol dehydrogenase family)
VRTPWTTSNIPSQRGRTAVVTGTGGLGLVTALELARAGASVVIAGRNPDKGANAVAQVRAAIAGAKLSFLRLDLCSLASVRRFCDELAQAHRSVDMLINNAGVMAIPNRRLTEDGFEVQFGGNYLGHFALTGGLLPLLRAAEHPRVVCLSSLAHKSGRIRFKDPQWASKYQPWGAYSQSKLAMLMFALELQRRSDAAGWGLLSTAAHPGFARTELAANSSDGMGRLFLERFADTVAPYFSQSAEDGALPSLFAATAQEAEPAGYYGPSGFLELKGTVSRAAVARHARDRRVGKQLWELSQDLTGQPFP